MLGRGALGFVLGVLATIALGGTVRLFTQEAHDGIVKDERWPMAKLQKLARDKMLTSVVSSLTESYRTERPALSKLTLDQQINERSPAAIRTAMLLATGGKAYKANPLADFVRNHRGAAATCGIDGDGLTLCITQCEGRSGVLGRKPHPGACRALCTVAVNPCQAMGANAWAIRGVLIAGLFYSAALLIVFRIIKKYSSPAEDDAALPAARQQISKLKLQSLVRIRKRLSLQEGYSALHDSGAWRIFEEMRRRGEGERRERGFQLLRFVASHRETRIMAIALARWKFAAKVLAVLGNNPASSDGNNCSDNKITDGDHTTDCSSSSSSSSCGKTPVAMGGPSQGKRGTAEEFSEAESEKQQGLIVGGG